MAALQRIADLERRAYPEDPDYEDLSHLGALARERPAWVEPRSLGQALRISGLTPADITVLAVQLAARKSPG